MTLYQFTILFKYDWWMKNASIYWYKWVKSTGVSYSFTLCFLTPLLWCLVVWNMNCEDRKGTSRLIFEVVYVWPFVACALGFYFQKQFSFYQLAMAWHHNSVPIDRVCLNLNDLLMSFLWILHHHQQCDNFQGGCKEL